MASGIKPRCFVHILLTWPGYYIMATTERLFSSVAAVIIRNSSPDMGWMILFRPPHEVAIAFMLMLTHFQPNQD